MGAPAELFTARTAHIHPVRSDTHVLHDRRWRCASDAETEQPTRAPEKFARVFLLQLIYKTLWLLFVFVPRAIHGVAPGYAWVLAGVFASYVILDVIALPFASLLARPTTSR